MDADLVHPAGLEGGGEEREAGRAGDDGVAPLDPEVGHGGSCAPSLCVSQREIVGRHPAGVSPVASDGQLDTGLLEERPAAHQAGVPPADLSLHYLPVEAGMGSRVYGQKDQA